MTRVFVDSATLGKFREAQQPLEVCDNSGQVVGHFIPTVDRSRCSALEPQVSEEELDRRERVGGGRSLAEIMADLEKRS